MTVIYKFEAHFHTWMSNYFVGLFSYPLQFCYNKLALFNKWRNSKHFLCK